MTTIEAKWLGACKPDQKPGDIVMPGGFKLNIKDARKAEGPAAEIICDLAPQEARST